jgi:hypothetical protein
VLLCGGLSLLSTVAYGGGYLDADVLAKAYLQNCESNIQDLRADFQRRQVKIADSSLGASDHPRFIGLCGPSDPIYLKILDPAPLQKTEDLIRKKGVAKYIEDTLAGLAEGRSKHKIDELLRRPELTELELRELIFFARSEAAIESIVVLLEPRAD